MSDVLSTPFENVIPEAGGGSGRGVKDSNITTPFTSAMNFPGLKDSPGVYDHNEDPYFSKPHSMGPDTIPMKFHEGIPAGGTLDGNADLNTPMSHDIPIKKVY